MSDNLNTTVSLDIDAVQNIPIFHNRLLVSFLETDASKWAPGAAEFIFAYGLKQYAGDGKAGSAAEARDAMQAKLDKLVSGEFGRKGRAPGAGATLSPLEAMAQTIASKTVKAMVKADTKAGKPMPSDAALDAMVATIAALPEIIANAQDMLDAKARAAAILSGAMARARVLNIPGADTGPDTDETVAA
jgi:hypothetical protein